MSDESRRVGLLDKNAPHWTRIGVLVGIGSLALAAAGIAVPIVMSVHSIPESPAIQPQPALNSPSAVSGLCGQSSETDLPVGRGPERLIFTDETYPDSLTFNSTYRNENYGDERNWVTIKPASVTEAGGWVDDIEVESGEEYLVRAYLHLDGPAEQIAESVIMRFNVPNCTAHRIGVEATLSSGNTFPSKIWDGAEFWSREDFNLTVLPDSAEMVSNRYPDPNALPLPTYDLVSAEGALLASDETPGEFLPGYAESAIVTFRVIARMP